jgi:hypothetical protein
VSRRWEVVLDSGTKLDIGPWRANMQWAGNADGPDEATAVAAAREKCRETMGDQYADGRVVRVTEIHTWEVTLRGRHDKRRRETFTVRSTDERHALQRVGYISGVYQFAGSIDGRHRDNVVKVERVSP